MSETVHMTGTKVKRSPCMETYVLLFWNNNYMTYMSVRRKMK